jgi:hypothetical protein
MKYFFFIKNQKTTLNMNLKIFLIFLAIINLSIQIPSGYPIGVNYHDDTIWTAISKLLMRFSKGGYEGQGKDMSLPPGVPCTWWRRPCRNRSFAEKNTWGWRNGYGK